jgi:hypothetical protein
MSTDWPDDERPVEIDPDEAAQPDSDPETRDAETYAETPLELGEEQLRGEGPTEQV